MTDPTPSPPSEETETARAKRLAGAPKDPRTAFDERFVQVGKVMYANGATDAEVADACGVSHRTICTWRHRYPQFDAVRVLAKEAFDGGAERKLAERAYGYDFQEEQVFVRAERYEEVITAPDGTVTRKSGTRSKVIRVEVRKHLPPSETALIFWLKNRKPNEWRDKLDLDHTYKPAEVTEAPMTLEEWDAKHGAAAASPRAN